MEEINIPEILNELFSYGLRAEDIASKTGSTAMTIYRWKNSGVVPRNASKAALLRVYRYEKKKRERK